MVTKAIAEAFDLNQSVSGMSETDIAVSTGEGVQDIWKYQVPVGYSLIFTSEDVFSAYLETSAPAEAGAGSLVDIVIQDSSKQNTAPILNQVRYAQVKEFQDRNKLAHLDIPVGKESVAPEGSFVVVRGNINGTLDASDSYFSLSCKRVRRTLFK